MLFAAVLLPGARLGAGIQVGAGAVVRGEHPAGAVIAGTPARLLWMRGEGDWAARLAAKPPNRRHGPALIVVRRRRETASRSRRSTTSVNGCDASVGQPHSPPAGAVGVALYGAQYANAQRYGPTVCRFPAAKGRLALTYDDGPDPAYTPRLLDLLGSYDAKAAFFLIGGWAAREPGQSARGAPS